jgi:hypothetical protein
MAGSVSIQDAERRSFRGTKLMVSPLGRSISTNADWPAPVGRARDRTQPIGGNRQQVHVPLAPPAAHLHHHARCMCREVVERDHAVIRTRQRVPSGGVAHHAPNGTAVRHHGKPSLRGAHTRSTRFRLHARGPRRARPRSRCSPARSRPPWRWWLARSPRRTRMRRAGREEWSGAASASEAQSIARTRARAYGQIAAPYGATRSGCE